MHLAGGGRDQHRVLVAEVAAAREGLPECRQRERDRATDVLGVSGGEHRGVVSGGQRAGQRSGCNPSSSTPRVIRSRSGSGGSNSLPWTGSHSGGVSSSDMIRSATR